MKPLGKSHLMDFRVNGSPLGTNGSEMKLNSAQTVRVSAKVAARLDEQANEKIRSQPYDRQPYWDIERARVANSREVPVELIVNGNAVARKTIVADGRINVVTLDVEIDRWLLIGVWILC
jgi:hypothetical protein